MYLCNRIRSHTDTHDHFTRNRLNIDTPFARTKIRNRSYFVFICKKFNDIVKNIDTDNISVHTFKIRCKKYLLSNQ